MAPPGTGGAGGQASVARQVAGILVALKDGYQKTPLRLKLLDVFLLYALASGGIQFLYCLLGGKFPFNAFLASFLGHVSFFALTLALRQQLDPATSASEFPGLSAERAVADYVLANLVVLLAVWNYLG